MCGTPASLFSNETWNGVSAGAVTLVCSYLTPRALIWTTSRFPDAAGPLAPGDAAPLGGGVSDGAGA